MQIFPMRLGAPVCFWLYVLFVVIGFCYGDHSTVEVVGIGECADCKRSNIKNSHAFSGLHVTIDCKLENGQFKTRGYGELDKKGKFKVSLPNEIVKDGELKEECYAQLHSASAASCTTHDGLDYSKIVIKSKTGEKYTLGPVGKLKFSSVTCTSAFLWHFSKFPPLPKLTTLAHHSFFKRFGYPSPPKFFRPFPPKIFPPKIFDSFPPKVFPPSVPIYKKPLPPPPTPICENPLPPPAPNFEPHPPLVPVYENPIPPPTPIYEPHPPPVPVYEKPCPPPTPNFEPHPPLEKPLPPPTPIYKPHPPPVPIYENPISPPTPIYEPHPPPVPVYEKPCPPSTPINEPHPPPVPAYNKPLPPPVPIYKKPLPPHVPVYKPHPPPIPIFKKPCPPIFKKPHPPFIPIYKPPFTPKILPPPIPI